MEKTVKIKLESIKDSGGWFELMHDLKFEEFKQHHQTLDEDELYDKFHSEVVYTTFEHGEYASFEIEIDSNLNIVGGRIIPFKESLQRKQ